MFLSICTHRTSTYKQNNKAGENMLKYVRGEKYQEMYPKQQQQ